MGILLSFIGKRESMSKVKVSPKFQIVIPKEIRQKYGLKAGATVEVISYGNRIEIIPIDSIKKLNGFIKGIDTTIIREDDRI
jgi:AbrB family looped-hinge helix DNA binding protein